MPNKCRNREQCTNDWVDIITSNKYMLYDLHIIEREREECVRVGKWMNEKSGEIAYKNEYNIII